MASATSKTYHPGKKLEEIGVTKDELAKFSKALKDEGFRKLLGEYVEEIQDPENRKRYEEEIALLEQERGYDVTWIHPEPGFVLKLQTEAGGKAFINVCSNANVGAPSCARSGDHGPRGINWSIPYAQSRPREDRDKAGAACCVYDVIFHPDTLYMAGRSPPMRRLVEDTAVQAVQDAFQAGLVAGKVARPKLKYKGVPQASVVRRRRDGGAADAADAAPLPDAIVERLRREAAGLSLSESAPAGGAPAAAAATTDAAADAAGRDGWETPEYKLVYRDTVDMQRFAARCGGGAPRPQALLLRIQLPKLTSAAGLDLDVGANSVRLASTAGQPHRYRLDVALPLTVEDRAGSATFDRAARCLVVTLPTAAPAADCLPDSGIDSDGAKNESDDDACRTGAAAGGESDVGGSDGADGADADGETDAPPVPREAAAVAPARLYRLPEHALEQDAERLHVLLTEPSLEWGSVRAALCGGALTVSATSVGAGLTPFHFRLRLEPAGALAEPAVRPCGDGGAVRVTVEKGAGDWTSCRVGVDEDDLQEVLIPWKTEEPAAVIGDRAGPAARPSVSASSLGSVTSYDGTFSVSSQSSVDESSQKKSILKKRYASESSADEVFTPGSSLVYGSMLHSCDEADESRAKKAVRFSDRVLEKRYRSNSTILHDVQRTERQRAKKKRQRAARRHSEGDTSENDEFRMPARDGVQVDPPLPQPVAQRASSDGDTSENDEFAPSSTDSSTVGVGGKQSKAAKKRKNKRKQERKQKDQLNNELMFDLDM